MVAAAEPDVDLLGWDSSVLGRGHYKGDVFANRIGVAVFISYGGKDVAVPAEKEPITAMDLSVDTPRKIELHALKLESMRVEVLYDQSPPTGMDHSDWVGPTVMAASVMSCFVPGGQVIGAILGYGKLLYDAMTDDTSASEQFSGHGYASVKFWVNARKSTDSEDTEISGNGKLGGLCYSPFGAQVTTMDGTEVQEGVSEPRHFEGEGLKVGDMFSVFLQLDTTAQMEARKTGEGTKAIEVHAKVRLINPETFRVWLTE